MGSPHVMSVLAVTIMILTMHEGIPLVDRYKMILLCSWTVDSGVCQKDDGIVTLDNGSNGGDNAFQMALIHRFREFQAQLVAMLRVRTIEFLAAFYILLYILRNKPMKVSHYTLFCRWHFHLGPGSKVAGDTSAVDNWRNAVAIGFSPELL